MLTTARKRFRWKQFFHHTLVREGWIFCWVEFEIPSALTPVQESKIDEHEENTIQSNNTTKEIYWRLKMTPTIEALASSSN